MSFIVPQIQDNVERSASQLFPLALILARVGWILGTGVLDVG